MTCLSCNQDKREKEMGVNECLVCEKIRTNTRKE